MLSCFSHTVQGFIDVVSEKEGSTKRWERDRRGEGERECHLPIEPQRFGHLWAATPGFSEHPLWS